WLSVLSQYCETVCLDSYRKFADTRPVWRPGVRDNAEHRSRFLPRRRRHCPCPRLAWRTVSQGTTQVLERIERLRELGYDLRRPEADLLRDGVYKLRGSLNHVQYRILYSFHTESGADRSERPKTVKRGSVKHRPKDSGQAVVRRTVAVLAHGLVKED